MIVSIANTGAAAVVAEGDDLTRLHVELAADADLADADADADAALGAAGLGRLDGDIAWLSVAGLRATGVGLADDWLTRFDAMVGYAAGKGWCSADGAHLQAHVEPKRREAES